MTGRPDFGARGFRHMTGLVQPFISTVIGSLDSKGRVCIPAAYRHILAAQNTAGRLCLPQFFRTRAGSLRPDFARERVGAPGHPGSVFLAAA